MTDNEKEFLLNLLDKHELSLYTIICALGVGATMTAIFAGTQKNEALEHAMIDLDSDCIRFLTVCMEENMYE